MEAVELLRELVELCERAGWQATVIDEARAFVGGERAEADARGLHGAPVADEIKGRGTPSRFVRNADGTVEWDPFPLTPDCLDAFRDLISELEAEG
jgi:hypothetical protein